MLQDGHVRRIEDVGTKDSKNFLRNFIENNVILLVKPTNKEHNVVFK